MSRTTCTYHCRGYPYSGCDGHFSSLGAFDRHRTGPMHDRRCVDPVDDDRFEPLTGDGFCAHIRPGPREGVTVWTLAGTAADRERLNALRDKPQTASEAQT